MPPTRRGRPWRWWMSRVVTPLLFGGIATLAAACLQSSSTETGLTRLERDAYSWHLLHRHSRPPNPALALIAGDDAFFDKLQDPEITRGERGRRLGDYRAEGCDCPIPRTCYARAIRRLKKWGARGIVLDIEFRSAGHAADQPGEPDEDEELAAAIQEAGNVVVSGSTEMLPLDRTSDPLSTADLIIHPPTPQIEAVVGEKWGSPRIDPQEAAYLFEPRQTAFNQLTAKLDDFYALPYVAATLYQKGTLEGLGDLYPWNPLLAEDVAPRLLGDFFSLRPAREQKQQAPAGDAGGDATGDAAAGADFEPIHGSVVVDNVFYQKRLLINFSSGADPAQGRYLPDRLSRVLEMPDAEGRSRFGGRLVILGLPGHDLHKTVVGRLPGQEILANATATMLDRNPIRPVQPAEVLLLMVALATGAALAVRNMPAFPASLTVIAELAGLQLLAAFLLDRHNVALMTVTPSAALLGAGLAAGVWESNRARSLVARLLPDRISRMMERSGGFQVEEGTVLFSDIRGYSTFSERLDPAVLMTNLNHYFAAVQEVLKRHGGHFVKAPGDCVVAWFADDGNRVSHRQRSITAALELLENAERFQRPWQEAGMHPFAVGVGINSGPMAVGVLDAHRHIEPTVIGDSVNLAARIESMAREANATLLVSEETLLPVRAAFQSDYLGEFKVPGRAQPVRIYRILGTAARSGGPTDGKKRPPRSRRAAPSNGSRAAEPPDPAVPLR